MEPLPLVNLEGYFKTQLEDISAQRLTVQSINLHAEDVLTRLISLVSRIVAQYRIEFPEETAEGKELEDKAFIKYGLQDLGEYLERASELAQQLAHIEELINEYIPSTPSVITPPDVLGVEITSGSGTFEKKGLLPRLKTLLYILEFEFGINAGEIVDSGFSKRGAVTDEMMRKTPYFAVKVEDLDRLVYICDEEGNASYVFDTQKLKEEEIDPYELDEYTKEQRNELITEKPGIGIRIVQNPHWAEQMIILLREKIPYTEEKKREVTEEAIARPLNLMQERKKELLPFDELVAEVREAGVQTKDQYQEERKNRTNWPSNPDRFYKNSGWVSWLDLFGKEKKEFLPFLEFVEKVRAADIQSGSQYGDEYDKHQGWPAAPYKYYKNSGWVSWPDLFGKEKKEFLPFDEFVTEVREAGVQTIDQYREEQKNHTNWPAHPEEHYKNSGLVDWYHLFGKEKKEFLPFLEFVEEVRAAGVLSEKKYREEQKNHTNWPSTAHRSYKNSGWVSWPDLFGKEKKEFLPFDEFVTEVREAGVQSRGQYQEEQKNHTNWPSNPDRFYKNSGWVSWLDLFGKEKKPK